MSAMNEVIVIQDGFMIGTWLARYFGLGSRYFSQISRRNCSTLNDQVEVKRIEGIVFVSVPKEIRQHINDGYTACKIEAGDDTDMYNHIFELTRDTKIGFWK